MEIPNTVYVIWSTVLIVAYAAVPVLLYVLNRILKAAKKIARYAAKTKRSSAGIKSHIEKAPALIETNKLLAAGHEVADDIASEATAIVNELVTRAGNNK